ncbi:hypothetical protein TAMA11512_13980 [Selenomonas sp. TAMA-11512]|nr:hypothetical protein TAMA11512_13980 [Selenomonas sp. TAMA-11512]
MEDGGSREGGKDTPRWLCCIYQCFLNCIDSCTINEKSEYCKRIADEFNPENVRRDSFYLANFVDEAENPVKIV